MAGGREPYNIGYRAERWTVKHYESKGWYTRRMRASHGDFDVLAVHPKGDETHFIEVKTFKTRPASYAKARQRLSKIPRGPGVRRFLHVWGPRRPGVKTPLKVEEV